MSILPKIPGALLDYLNAQRRLNDFLFNESDYRANIPASYGQSRDKPWIEPSRLPVNVTLMYSNILDLVGFLENKKSAL